VPMDLNVVTFIFFALAVVIFIQLRSVLGKRTGHERRAADIQQTVNDSKPKEPEANAAAEKPADPYAEIDAYTPAGGRLNEALRAIRKADGNFAPKEFLAGARAAYEMILTAFAKGDLLGLKRLLSPEVYADFSQAVEKRRNAGETVKFSFVGIDKADIADAELDGREARVAVSFRADIISTTYDSRGKKIEGDEQDIVRLQDRWTFARNVDSKAPDWLLAATEDESA